MNKKHRFGYISDRESRTRKGLAAKKGSFYPDSKFIAAAIERFENSGGKIDRLPCVCSAANSQNAYGKIHFAYIKEMYYE